MIKKNLEIMKYLIIREIETENVNRVFLGQVTLSDINRIASGRNIQIVFGSDHQTIKIVKINAPIYKPCVFGRNTQII